MLHHSLVTSPPKAVLAFLEQPALVWVGLLSYGLYLWHVPIFHGVLNEARMARMGITGVWLHLLRWTVTFGVAEASYYLIERRMLELKRWFRHEHRTRCMVIVSRNASDRIRDLAQELATDRRASVIVDRRLSDGPVADSNVGSAWRGNERRVKPEIDARIRSAGYAVLGG
jgi:peptidoglycan/LPS O-acetylase OafA/YrhL